MSLILVSEHYVPRLGGVTSYIKRLIRALVKEGQDICLIVPSEEPRGKITRIQKDGWSEIHVGCGVPLSGIIPRKVRIYFCQQCNALLTAQDWKNIDVLHVLYGMYLLARLDFDKIPKNVFKSCTIHNVPPKECRNSWPGDTPIGRVKDLLRLRAVQWVNGRRIKQNPWNAYVVPSHCVERELSTLVSADKVHVIGHGIEAPPVREREEKSDHLNILTISGIVPHKGLHHSIGISERLRQEGLTFRWIMVGAIKNKPYFDYLEAEIERKNLSEYIQILPSASHEKLADLLQKSTLYVHLSQEEGFCLAVLEAMISGLPCIGVDTGAIREIIDRGKGVVVEPSVDSFFKGITQIVRNPENFVLGRDDVNALRQHYDWQAVAQKYLNTWHIHA